MRYQQKNIRSNKIKINFQKFKQQKKKTKQH